MTIYENYLILISISLLSFIVAVIYRTKKREVKNESLLVSEKYVWLLILLLLGYSGLRIFSDWRFSNFYVEALIILIVFIFLDYLIIVKYQYSKKLNVMFYSIRTISMAIPLLFIGIVLFMAVITFGYGGTLICKVFPLDTSYGEQNVYKNIYVYKDECSHSFVFKKKFLLFEKNVVAFPGDVITVFGGGISRDSIATGHITRYKNDSITITGRKENNIYGNDYFKNRDAYLKVVIIKPRNLKIERIIFTHDNFSNGYTSQVIESVNVKL